MIRNAAALMYRAVQLLHQGIWLIVAMASTFAGNFSSWVMLIFRRGT